MKNRRPSRVILGLAITAIVSFIATALLDVHGTWRSPRQDLATFFWVVFLLSVLAIVVTGVRLLVVRGRTPATH